MEDETSDSEDEMLQNLDRLVAVQIMGWTPVYGDWWPGAVCPGAWNCDVDAATGWAFEYDSGGIRMPNGKTYCARKTYEWCPTDSIPHAFEVVDAMRKNGFDLFELSQMPGGESLTWFCSFRPSTLIKDSNKSVFQEQTAPLAITAAALSIICGDAIVFQEWWNAKKPK